MIPIALTDVEWNFYIQLCRESGIEEPTRGLDADKISTKDPASFAATLGFSNHPLETLRNDNTVLKHTFITFTEILTEQKLLKFLSTTELAVTYKELEDRKYFTVFSGSLYTIRQEVIENCQHNKELRQLYCSIYDCLTKTRFREIWSNYTKSNQPDGTFILHTRY